jgi:hypothetical protein
MTLMPLKRPLTSPLSFAPTCGSVSLVGLQRCFGDTSSYGSATDFSHGFGSVPRLVFSTSSVRPPEVEKKNVTTGSPSYVTTWPRVSVTAWFVDGVSAATPP